MKTHCKYGHPLSGDNLYVSPKGIRNCRACVNRNHTQYRSTPKGMIAAKRRDLRESGWTVERYEETLRVQGNACAICKIPFESFPKGPFADHDHILLTARGLLCNDCNLGLGHFKDNPSLLELAAQYLRKYGKS